MAKSNRTHERPPKIENLGDGTFLYIFDVVESQTEEGEPNFDYNEVRVSYPIDAEETQQKPDPETIQQQLDAEGYEHQVDLNGYEETE